MPLNKVHQLRTQPNASPARTACGMEGWQCKTSKTEFDTAACDRFEAVTSRREVTCKRCLAAEPRAIPLNDQQERKP